MFLEKVSVHLCESDFLLWIGSKGLDFNWWENIAYQIRGDCENGKNGCKNELIS